MKTLLKLCAAACVLLLLSTAAWSAELNAVPGQVQFTGRVNLTTQDTEALKGVTFALFSEQTGGAALWMETQNVGVDASGAYSTLRNPAPWCGSGRNRFQRPASRAFPCSSRKKPG